MVAELLGGVWWQHWECIHDVGLGCQGGQLCWPQASDMTPSCPHRAGIALEVTAVFLAAAMHITSLQPIRHFALNRLQ